MRANPDSPERLRLSNRTRLIVVMIEVIAMLAAMLGPAVAQDNGTSGSPSSQATVDTQPQQDAQPQADPTPAPTPDPTPDPTPKPDRPAQQQPDPAPQQQDPTPDPTPKAQADPTPQPVDPTPDPTPAPQPTPDAQPTPDQAQPTPDQSTPAPQPTPDQSTPNPDPATPDPANPTPDAQPTPDQSTPNPEQPTPAPTDTPAPSADPDASAAPSPSASPAPSASAAPSPSASPALPETKPLIVRFVAGTTAAQQDAVIAALGGTQTDSYPALRMRVIKVAPSLSAEIVAAYRADPRVATIENDRVRDADAAPNDPAWDNQWNLRQISWGKARDAANVAGSATIAVLDTGVDGNHPDLASRIAGSWSAFPNGDALSDPNGHGTAMAGIAAAVPDNGDAVAGVAWANTSILAVQVLAADGTGQDSDIIGGVLWAADHGADVILMAFSNPGYSTALQAAIDYAWGRGAVLVAAAGNDGSSTPAYPGGDHHVMGVTATNSNDQLSAGANSGQAVFIAAPGDAIPATWPNGGWTTLGGTSPAAAQVAGAAAILKAIDPSAGNGEIVGRLARTADPAGAEWETGNGRINLQRAAADSGSAWIDPSGAPGGGPYVGPYTAAATIYWVGCANTDWTNANNWSTSSSATCSAGVPSTGAGAPVGTDTATILTGKTNYPSISTGTVTISTLTINSGGTVTVAGGTLAVTLTFTDTGTLTISSGVMTVASTNTSTVASGGVLNVNGGSFQTSGALSVSGTINQAGGVLHMNVALATKPSVSVTLNATGRLNLSAGSFETYSFVAASGSASTQTGGTFKLYRNFQNSGTYAGSAGTFEVAGSGSSSSAFNSPGTNRFYNVLVDSGITARFSSVSNFAMSVRGDWTINGTASLTSRNTTVTFDGTGTQTIGGTSSTTFRNLIVNKTSGSLVLARNTTVATTTSSTGVLTLTAGKITTGINTLIIASGGSVSRTAGFVEGNLQKVVPIASSTAITFEVGAGTVYAPATVTFTNVTVAGTLVMSSPAGQHPQIASSRIVTTQDVNRYWTSTLATAVFTGASLAMTYPSTDVLGGTPASFITQRYSGTTWTTPTSTTTGTTSLTTTVTGLTAFGGFAIGIQVGVAVNGDGTLTVSPSTVIAGATGNSLSFAFTAPATRDFDASSSLTIDVPAGWTAPQTSSSSTAGYVSAIGSTCTPGSVNVSGSGPWTITIAQACAHGTSFTVVYGGDSSTKATAPKIAGSVTFTAKTKDGAGGTLTAIATSPVVTVAPDAPVKLQVLLPGETTAPGTGSGKTGTASHATAGTPVSVTVNAVDQYWNRVTTQTPSVHLTTTDPNDEPPADADLVAGTLAFPVTFRTAVGDPWTITASAVSPSTLTSDTSSNLSVDSGTAVMLQVLLSGETAAPGTTTGKTGIPNDLTAGGTTTVTVNAVDAFWNPVSSATPSVTIAASPAQITGLPSTASLSSGARSLVLTPTTAGDFVLTATDNGGSPLTSGTSDGFTVFAGNATHLRVTAPGSTTAGAQFNVTVTALDGYDNTAPTYAGTVHFTSTDGGATLPANSTLTNGAGTFSATLATQGTQTITGTDTNTGTITGTSNSITVAPSAAQTISLVLSPTSITANFSATTTATVTIKDGSNNPLQGKTVTITQNGDVTVGTVTDNHNGTYTATITASKTSGVTTITATDTTDSIFTTTNLTEVAGPATQLAVLLPGETIAAGTGVKSWTSSAYVATAGTAFNITVRALDQYFNLATTATPTVTFASRIAGSADSTAVLPGSTTLVGGTRTVSVTPKAATTTTNWVIVASSNPLVDGTGTAIKVDAGAAARLQVLMPGEAGAPGTATGKTGTPINQTVGSAVSVTVRAVDANWNVVTSGTGSTTSVTISSSDANAVLPSATALVAGTGSYAVTFKTAGGRTVSATGGSLTANTGSQVTVLAGAATQLQVLLPGETADPGSATGKTGTPTTQVASAPLTVTVRAVDTYFNLATGATGTIALTTTDTHAVLPATDQLVSGSRTFSITFKTANGSTGWTVRATESNGAPALPFGTSAAVRVSAGSVAKLQILLPGETAVPGSSTGKSGSPTGITAGDVIETTVNAVDADWNVVGTATPTVQITSSTDPSATLPSAAALISGTGTFLVTLVTAGGRTMTVTDNGSALTASTSATVVVSPSDADHYTLSAPSPVTVGVAFQLSVTIRDLYGNVVPLYGGTVQFTSNDGSAILPADATLTNGTGTFSATLRTVGTTLTITATDADDNTIVGSTSNLTVQTAAAFNIALTLTAGSISVDPSTSTVVATATVTNNVGTGLTGKTVTISQTRGSTTTPMTVSAIGGGQYQATIPASTVAGSTTITATDVTDGSIVATATLVYTADAATKLQVLLPGEIPAPGTVNGKDSTNATAIVAGDTINVTVNAVDPYWNIDTTVTHTVRIGALLSTGPDVTDSTAVLPADGSLISGTRTFSVTLRRAGARIVTATDQSAPALTTGSASTTVATGSATHLQILLVGETAAPGTVSGKTGTPTTLNAGTATTVTVNAVDAWNNIVTSATPTVTLAGLVSGSTESTAQMGSAHALSSGTYGFPVTFRRVAIYTVTGTDAASPGLGTATSASVLVDHGAFAQLQLLLPGETAAPGTLSGVTGSPSTVTAGSAITVRVVATDSWWNLVDAVTSTVTFGSQISSVSDGTALLPGDTPLVLGAATVSVQPRKATASTDWAVTGTTAGKNGTSTAVKVNAGAATKLQVLLGGETAAPGTASGKIGTPTDRTADQATDLTVNAVDEWWNPVSVARNLNFAVLSSPTGTGFTSGTGTTPAGAALVSGTYHTASGLQFTTAAFNEVVVTAAAGSPNLASATSAAVHTFAGATTHLQLDASGQLSAVATTAGVAKTVTVTALDAHGNVALTYAGTFKLTSTDIAAVLPSGSQSVVAGTGKGQFSVTLKTVGTRTIGGTGTQTLTVTDDLEGTTGVAHDDMTMAMSPNVAATQTLVLKQNGSVVTTIVADPDPTYPVTTVATVTDAFGNAVSGQSVAITPINGGDATIGSPEETAPGSYVADYVANRLAHTETIQATDSSITPNLVTTLTIVETPGPLAAYRILMPGETAVPGDLNTHDGGDGKSGTPTDQTAGNAFTVRVDAVDEYWNVIDTLTTTGGKVALTTTAPAGTTVIRSTIDVTAGTEQVEVVLRSATASGWTITATSTTPAATGTSSAVKVLAGSATKLQVLLPGQSAAPGTAIGWTTSPSPVTAGNAFTVTVNAVDAWWNVVSSTHTIAITSSEDSGFVTLPVNQALVAGTYGFSATLFREGRQTFTATDTTTPGTLAAVTSQQVTVTHGSAVAYLVLLPGETAVPGSQSAPGKTGTADTVQPGSNVMVTVEAVDGYYNIVETFTNQVTLTSDGSGDAMPSAVALDAGVGYFPMTAGASGSRTITASGSSLTGTATLVVAAADGNGLLVVSPTTLIAGSTGNRLTFTFTSPSIFAVGSELTIRVPAGWTEPTAHVIPDPDADGEVTVSNVSGCLPLTPVVTGTGPWTISVTFSCALDGSFEVHYGGASATTKVTAPTLAGSYQFQAKSRGALGTLQALAASPSVFVDHGAYSKLQVLLPGEVRDPGTATGKTSANPSAITAGTPITVHVYAVDTWYNLVDSVTSDVTLASKINGTADDTAIVPGATQLTAGVQSLIVVPRTATASTDWTLTASTTSPSHTGTSAAAKVDAGTATKLQVLLTGETAAPGTPSGKTGAPTDRTADQTTRVTVKAVDDWWNPVGSGSGALTFTAYGSPTDSGYVSTTTGVTLPGHGLDPVSLSAGAYVPSSDNAGFTVAGWYYVTVTADGLTTGTSAVVDVRPGAADHLELDIPATAEPVSTTAGQSRTVTVGAYDDHDNLATGYTGTFTFTSSDAQATLPSGSQSTIPGTGKGTFTVTLRTAGSKTITATDASLTAQSSHPGENVLDWTVSASHAEQITLALWQDGAPLTSVVADPDGHRIDAVSTIADAYGNPVPSQAVAFTIDVSDGHMTGSVTESPTGTYSQQFVTGRKADTDTITVTDSTPDPDLVTTLTFVETPGALVQYRVLVPGETADPGDLATGDGKTGTPTTQVAGTPFEITVDAVDEYWNVITSLPTRTVTLTTSAAAGTYVLPATTDLVDGTEQVQVELRTATTDGWTVTAASSSPTITGTSSAIKVNAGTASRLQILLPGEIAAPGTAAGHTGSATQQTAGATVTATVRATDAWWNLVTTATATARVTTSDPNGVAVSATGALSSGVWQPSGQFRTAGTWTVGAADVTADRPEGELLAPDTSGLVTVVHSTFAKLQVLVIPDETEAPGSESGHTGTVDPRTAGDPVAIRVNAVDAYWNLVDDVTANVTLTSDEAHAILPASADLVAGTKDLAVTFKVADAGGWTVTATGGSKSGTGSVIPVEAGAAVKLQVLLQNEVAEPGTDDGTNGTPVTDIHAGGDFTVTVNAVDAFWNIDTNATPTVRMHATEAGQDYDHAVLPDDTALAAGTWTFTSKAYKAGYPVYTATDLAGILASGTSADIDIDPGTAVKLQVLLPGQAADPGTDDGVIGSPFDQPLGTVVDATVNAVDAYWNIDTTATPTVHLTSSDTLAALPPDTALVAGTGVLVITFHVAGTQTVTATKVSGGLTAATSANVLITGTSLQVPTTVATGTGFPGQVVTSSTASVTWQSTDSSKKVKVVLSAALTDGNGHSIAMTDAQLLDANGNVIGTLDAGRLLVQIPTFTEGQTSASGSTGFKIRIRIPSAVTGTYSAALSYTVAAN